MKIKLQIIIALLGLMLSNATHAQNNMEDVVYLKNGSIIRGIIVEQIPNVSLKIQTNDRNVFVFKMEEIEKMTKEYLPNDNSNNTSNLANFKSSGFINLTELNYCLGNGDVIIGGKTGKNEKYSYGIKTVNGYQINEHFSLGVGLGIDIYDYKNTTTSATTTKTTFLPITFDARATILKGKVSPVFTANGGYAIGLNDVKGGLTFNPQIGIKSFISKNAALIFNIGYKWQEQEVNYSDGFDYYSQSYIMKKTNVYYQFISFSAGFSF